MANEAPPIDYRALLEEERSSLEHQLAELGFGDEGGRGLEYDSNFADTSQVTAERSETEVLVNELRSALKDVGKALGKIEDGSYGICERCGQPIAPARLEAMPAVSLFFCCSSASNRNNTSTLKSSRR